MDGLMGLDVIFRVQDKMPLDKMPPTVDFVFIFFSNVVSVCCLSMSLPMVISAYHKRCFAHTTLITGTSLLVAVW